MQERIFFVSAPTASAWTRSRLLVIPGTVAETRIRRAGLLDAAPLHRSFRFADPRTGELDEALSGWFDRHAAPVLAGLSDTRAGDLTTLAELKIAEWRWLTHTLDVPTTAPAPAGS